MTMEFLVLGPLAVRRATGEPVELGGPRQRAVLARLLAAGGHVVPAERIVDDLWQGEPPPRALGALQAYVSHLRRAIEPDRAPRAPATVLVSAAPGYALIAPGGALDADAFAADLRAAESAERPEDVLAAAERGLARWRGPAFADVVTEPWARDEAVRLEELRGRAFELRASALIDSGREAEAVGDLEVLVGRDPLREEPWRLLTVALYRSGRQGDALGALRRARDAMRDELGVDPGEALRTLEQAVLDQDPALNAERRAPVSVSPNGSAPSAPNPGHPAPPRPASVMVGRDADLARLSALLTSAPGEPRVSLALVSGDAGIGKSTLVSELAARAAEDGWLVAWGRCPESEGVPPLWPWAEVVAAVAEKVPFSDSEQAAMTTLGDEPSDVRVPSARFRMHRALAGYLVRAAADAPLLVVLDDVHRADDESLAALRFLAAARTSAPIVVVATARPDEQRAAVQEIAGVFAAHGGIRVDLDGIDTAATAELVRQVCAAEGLATTEDDVVAALVERTAGNPFYVRESARLLASEGALVATHEVPAGVRDVVRRRLARLPATAQNVLRTVAVIGRSAPVVLVVAADEHAEDDVYDALESAVVAGLLDEPESGVVRFTHALVRDTVFEDVPRLRRSRRHADVAKALLVSAPDDASALAYHFGEAAGLGYEAQARDHALAAARQAGQRFAHASAADWWARALEAHDRIGRQDAGDDVERPDQRARILMGLARALQLAGRCREARVTRVEAAREAEALGDLALLTESLTALDVPMLWGSRDYYALEDDGTYDRLRAALERTPEHEYARRVRLLAAMSDERVHGVNPDEALRHAEDAMRVARAHDVDPVALSVALNAAYNTSSRPGRHARLVDVARALQDVARANDLPGVEAIGLLAEVSAAQHRGDFAGAVDAADRAGLLAQTYELPVVTVQVALSRVSAESVFGTFEDTTRRLFEAAALPATQSMFDLDALVPAALLAYSRSFDVPVTPEESAIADGMGQRYPRFGPAVQALTVARSGDVDRARGLLDEPFDPFEDYMWMLVNAMRGEAAAAAGHDAAARDAYATLLPHADVVAGGETISLVLGPVASTLARLAVSLGDDAAARTHWQQALDLSRRARAERWEHVAAAGLAALGPR